MQFSQGTSSVGHNLQMPYAIRLLWNEKRQYYSLEWDCPTGFPPLKNFLKDPVEPRDLTTLKDITGMQEPQLSNFLSILKEFHKKSFPPHNNKQKIKQNLSEKLQNLGLLGLGDILGAGGHRISIESDKQLEKRMQNHLKDLTSCIDPPPDVCCLVEQAYKIKDNPGEVRRQQIIKKEMNKLNFVEVVSQNKRDVGIWVKKGLKYTLPPLSAVATN